MRLLLPSLLLSAAVGALLARPAGAQTATVGIGTTTPNAKAALDITAADKGLLIPRLDSVQRVALGVPPDGLMVFQRNGRVGLWYAFGGAWFYIPDKVKANDNLGNHLATRPIGWTTNDTDKLLFTQGGGANGSKIGHGGGWELNYYAGPNNASAGVHRFLTGAAGGWQERLRINSNGHVGIGTAAPRGKLDVDGPGDTYLVDNPNNGTTQSVFLPGHLYLAPYTGTSGTAFVQARVPAPTSSTNLGLTLRTTQAGNLINALTISSDGNVGLGTTTPAERLVVNGNATITGQAQVGLVRLAEDHSLSGNTWAGYALACPAGTRLIGGGGGHRDNNSAQWDIQVNYSGPRPNNPDTVWQLNVRNTGSSSRAVRIYCICARMQ